MAKPQSGGKAEVNKMEILRKENSELRLVICEQEQKLEESKRETEKYRNELDSIRSLHQREDGVHMLRAKPRLLPNVTADSVDILTQDELYQRQLVEMNQDLQKKLSQAQEQISVLQSSLSQKDQSVEKLSAQLQSTMSAFRYKDRQKLTHIDELEKALSEAQREKEDSQKKAESLQDSITLLHQRTGADSKQDQETFRNLTTAHFATQVKQLESNLSSCHEELSRSQKQMEEFKKMYEQQLQSKDRQVEALKEELMACRNSTEQKQQLQSELQDSNICISELEESNRLLFKRVTELETQLEAERMLVSYELEKTKHKAQESRVQCEKFKREAAELSTSVKQLQADMSKSRVELNEREREFEQSRNANGAQASQLNQMAKMLQNTKALLETKNKSVSILEEKVQCSEREQRNAVHRAQQLDSQMRACRGQLMDTLDQLREQQVMLHNCHQKAEERQAAVERISEELREAQGQLDQTRKAIDDKDEALNQTMDKLQETAHKLSNVDRAFRVYKVEMEQKLDSKQGELDRSAREVSERTKQVEYLTERLELLQAQIQQREKIEQDMMDQGRRLHECSEELQHARTALQNLRNHCKSLTLQLEDNARISREKESEVRHIEGQMLKLKDKAAEEESRLCNTISTLTQEIHTIRKQHQDQLLTMQESHAETLKASDSTLRTIHQSQLQVSEDLKQCRAQLERANNKSTTLLAELHKCEQLLQNTREDLLLKDSEITRLKTKLSCIERSKELQSITSRSDFNSTLPGPPPPSPESSHGLEPKEGQTDDSLLLQSGTLGNTTLTPPTLPNQAGIELNTRLRSLLTDSQEDIQKPL